MLIFTEKLLWYSWKPWKTWKFSPANLSSFTVPALGVWMWCPLEHIKGLEENKDFSRRTLSWIVVVLMAITGTNRVSEQQALNLRFQHFKTNRVLFKSPSLTKKGQLAAPLKKCSLLVSLRTGVVLKAVWNPDRIMQENYPKRQHHCFHHMLSHTT